VQQPLYICGLRNLDRNGFAGFRFDVGDNAVLLSPAHRRESGSQSPNRLQFPKSAGRASQTPPDCRPPLDTTNPPASLTLIDLLVVG